MNPRLLLSSRVLTLALLFIAAAFGTTSLRADEPDKLKDIVIAGEDWQPAVTGLGFADGLSTDVATGNLYFSDMKASAVFTLAPDGTKKKIWDIKASGTRPSADGKTLYAIGNKKLMSYALPDGPEAVIAENIGTNDLAVTRDGRIYFTGNGKMQVSMVDVKTKEVKAADTGNIKYPNGIGLSPDHKTLIVSDNAGKSVWTFSIQADGTLADRKAAMTTKTPEKTPEVSKGDGLAVDSTGRAYVTTALGVQIFSPAGELLGVLPKPKTASVISCAFAGKDLDYLYVSCGDTIYRRKLAVKGIPPRS